MGKIEVTKEKLLVPIDLFDESNLQIQYVNMIHYTPNSSTLYLYYHRDLYINSLPSFI